MSARTTPGRGGRLGRFFGRGRENEEDLRSVLAPVAGEVLPLDRVPDPAFASGALGVGAGVRPDDGLVVAPVSGTVATMMPHAYGIRRRDGAEVLVHVGIDTVQLEGMYFDPRVAQGAVIRAGDPLAHVDMNAVAEAGFDTTTVVVVLGSLPGGPVRVTTSGHVDRGQELLTTDT